MTLATSQSGARVDRPRDRHPLDVIFKPRSVAVIGATEKSGSVGRAVLQNLIATPFGGPVFPVNPKRSAVMGIKAYASIAEVPDEVDLAVLVTPASSIPSLVGDCVDAGVKGAIVISAGFKEVGKEGAKLEDELIKQAKRGRMPVIGPNCLGVMSPVSGLNATFAATMAPKGKVGFISQSGALCTAVLDWALTEDVGFSNFISIGAMADVGWGDLLTYLGQDPNTASIVIYMESIGNARAFLSAAREVALHKPIIVIKAGRSAAAAEAAASHTGSLTGSDDVVDAAFKRAGVLRVDSIDALFAMSEVLAKQPLPNGPRLTILTNAGGPGVLATDALIRGGGKLAKPSDDTMTRLNEFLPAAWSHGNPIDILGDADPARYGDALKVAAGDENSDGMLVILTPQAMTDPTRTAEHLRTCIDTVEKPVLASWMGGGDVQRGDAILSEAGVPTFAYPDAAVGVFNHMWQYHANLGALYETPALDSADTTLDRETAGRILREAREAGRTILTEYEAKRVLAAFFNATAATEIAESGDEAVAAAEQIGYPVVVKLHSYTITHKTDVGGVELNLANADAVREAFERIRDNVREKANAEGFDGVTVQAMEKLDGYETILGSSIDPQFGPVILFGSGGQLVEVYQDRALALPPLNTTLAQRLIERTRIHKALLGVRGRASIDIPALQRLLVRFSQLVVEHPSIKELDINPLLLSPEKQVALDARIIVHEKDVADADLPRSAIRPYPIEYVSDWTLKDGMPVTIRPIRPEDEPAMVRFHKSLSDRSVHMRYSGMLSLDHRTGHERLTRVCFNDYDRGMALVVEYRPEGADQHEILAVARLTRIHGTDDAEFALIVADAYQQKGLGSHLMTRLIELGKSEGIERIHADMLPTNTYMQRMCERFGFDVGQTPDPDDDFIHATLDLRNAE